MNMLRWDPKQQDGQPESNLDAKKMASLMKKNNIDLMTWKPDCDTDMAAAAGRPFGCEGSGSGSANKPSSYRALPAPGPGQAEEFIHDDGHGKVGPAWWGEAGGGLSLSLGGWEGGRGSHWLAV